MPKIKEIERGDVFWARLDPTVGSELQKTRPVVVLSINPLNKARKTVVVVPLSTSAPAIEFLNVEVPVFLTLEFKFGNVCFERIYRLHKQKI
jgi:mRNA interferase MazF